MTKMEVSSRPVWGQRRDGKLCWRDISDYGTSGMCYKVVTGPGTE